MMLLLLSLSYRGEGLYGWAPQPQGPTIAGLLQQTWPQVAAHLSQSIRLFAAARTDAGVHAFDQRVMIIVPNSDSAPDPLALEELKVKWQLALDQQRQGAIHLKQLLPLPKTLDMMGGCDWKEYWYLLTTHLDVELRPTYERRVMVCRETLDLELLNRLCAHYVGQHHFKAFCRRETAGAQWNRQILQASAAVLRPDQWPYSEQQLLSNRAPIIAIKFRGAGFLRWMVRCLVGGILNVQDGRISEEELLRALAGEVVISSSSSPVSFPVPPEGLYLKELCHHTDHYFSQ